MTHTPSEIGVLQAEARRCHALEQGDYSELDRLIAPDATYTHARGGTDEGSTYLQMVQTGFDYLSCARGPLKVKIVGEIAIMTGTMHNIMRRRETGEQVTLDAQVLQVWQWREDRWMIIAFQATRLPS